MSDAIYIVHHDPRRPDLVVATFKTHDGALVYVGQHFNLRGTCISRQTADGGDSRLVSDTRCERVRAGDPRAVSA